MNLTPLGASFGHVTLGEASDKFSHITAENFWLGDSQTLQFEFKFNLNIRRNSNEGMGSPYARNYSP